MVADTEGEHERHQNQQVVVVALPEVLLPPERQPRKKGDREERDGIDLLVHVRLAPDGERCRTHQDRSGGADQTEDSVFREGPEDVVNDEEP